MVVMMVLLLVRLLWLVRCCWFTYLGKRLLQRRYIGFIRVIGYRHSLRLHIKLNILDTTIEILVKRNILHDLITAVLAM